MAHAPETVVIYGGSFNPPHVSHLLAAVYVLATEAVSRVLVIPTFKHPFTKELAPFEDRLRMCELMFQGQAGVTVSAIERDLGGESRTVRTLEALKEENPHWTMRLLMGADLLSERHKWFAFARIEALAPPLVLGRAGYTVEGAPPPILPEVSSTDIRARLARGDETVRAFLSMSVHRYIAERALYGARTKPPPEAAS